VLASHLAPVCPARLPAAIDRHPGIGAFPSVIVTYFLATRLNAHTSIPTTTGNVSGFVIFRYNPNGQEAVAPLESRIANSFLVPFDNTDNTATGIAVNSVSLQTMNVPVIVRDDTGAQIATDTITLPPNAHVAFTLVTDKYPQTANIRGTVEFGTPPGGQIGALGIRIPTAHTFTTLPALAR